MFKNSSKILFLLILMSGTMLSVSSNSWLGAWMGLEINLLAFIPMMSNPNNLMSSESALKYFLTQAIASSVLLLSVILPMMKYSLIQNYNINMYTNFPEMITFSALIMKMGSAPFHFWFPSVMEGMSWMNAMLLMTWQKIAPMILIAYLNIKPLMYLSIIMSVMVGSLGGLNQTSIRKLMSFSSINHIGWMITAMLSSETLWIVYFTIYSILSINLIVMFNMFSILHINQMFSLFMMSKPLKFVMLSNLLSLGGLPPFLGFLPKWMVIQSLTLNNQMFLMTLITVFTLLTLFFYLRMCFSAFMLNYTEPGWFLSTTLFSNSLMLNMMIMTFISLFTLSSITLLYMMM